MQVRKQQLRTGKDPDAGKDWRQEEKGRTEDEVAGWHHRFNWHAAAAAAKSLQSCPTMCDPIDSSPPGSPVPGFSRQEHWSGLPFPSPKHESEKWKWSRSVVPNLATPWTAAYQAPPSMGFSRQEYWSGLPLPSLQWTWVWVNSGSWWWTGWPGVLWFMGSQRVGHDLVTVLKWTESNWLDHSLV